MEVKSNAYHLIHYPINIFTFVDNMDTQIQYQHICFSYQVLCVFVFELAV